MPIFDSFLPWRRPGVPWADHERGLPAMPEVWVDRRDDHVDVCDSPVGDEDLGPVEQPLVAVELGGGAEALHVGSGLWLGDRVGAELDLLVGPEALRHPLGDLIRSPGRGDAGCGQAGALDREGDSRAAPVELLGGGHAELTVGIGAHPLHVLEPLQAPLACLLDHLPGSALLLVVLAGGGADDLTGEPADLVPVLPLLVGEGEVHFERLPFVHARVRRATRLIDWSVSQSTDLEVGPATYRCDPPRARPHIAGSVPRRAPPTTASRTRIDWLPLPPTAPARLQGSRRRRAGAGRGGRGRAGRRQPVRRRRRAGKRAW